MNEPVMIILCCAFVTYLTRIGGHLILSRFGEIHHRVESALLMVPTAVLSALVAPALITHGPAEAIAIIAAALIALRGSLVATVATGMIVLVLLRQLTP